MQAVTILPQETPGEKSGNPYGDRFQAIQLKFHLGCFKAGMGNSRMSGTKLLALTGQVTGKSYKRGQYEAAHADILAWLEANPR
jgi:hypothetical protein